jgi:hypothetical protein
MFLSLKGGGGEEGGALEEVNRVHHYNITIGNHVKPFIYDNNHENFEI